MWSFCPEGTSHRQLIVDHETNFLDCAILEELNTDKTQNCSAVVHYAGKESGRAATFCFASVRMGI